VFDDRGKRASSTSNALRFVSVSFIRARDDCALAYVQYDEIRTVENTELREAKLIDN